MADMLVDQAHAAVGRITPEGVEVEIKLVWEPIWNPSMMSGMAKDFFGWQH
jgi:metal-sulfur cluster biosynthetic enzyme